jgi:hypothetical protein
VRHVAAFLAGLYFVLTLAAQNGAELLHPEDLARPVAISLVVAGFSWTVGRLALGSADKASLWATAVVVGFSSFGIAIQAAVQSGLLQRQDPVDGFLLLLLLSLLWLLSWLRRTSRKLREGTRCIALVSVLLVGWSSGRLALQTSTPDQRASNPSDSVITLPRSLSQLPDIYLVVVDKYTGSSLLKDHYGFDNSAFEQALRSRGFIVPRDARANYVNTFLALAAMLNLRYLDDLPGRFGRENPNRRLTYPIIEDNTFIRFLKAQGYRFVFFPSAFGATRVNRLADVSLPSPDSIRTEFYAAWRLTTVVPLLQNWACMLASCKIDQLPLVPESAGLLDWKLHQLAALSSDRRPTFAFLHLAIPHEPYHYRPDCRHKAPFWPPRDDGSWEPEVKAAYIAQIRCVNQKLLALVDTIQRRSEVPPLILIQSDHGHGRLGRSLPDLPQVPAERVKERLAVFAAYALPGLSAADVWDTISPVNVTRLVLRHYFGADFPPVDDRSYWSPLEHPYRLTRVQ